jgi:hypothetical protein
MDYPTTPTPTAQEQTLTTILDRLRSIASEQNSVNSMIKQKITVLSGVYGKEQELKATEPTTIIEAFLHLESMYRYELNRSYETLNQLDKTM